MDERGREIHLLLRDPAGERLLVDGAPPGALPSFTIELAARETTVPGAIAALRERFGLRSPLLEVHFERRRDCPA